MELSDQSYTFTNVDADHTIHVEFEVIAKDQMADLSGLRAAVDAVDRANLSGYSQTDLELLQQLMKQAREILSLQQVTQKDQRKVDALASALMDELGALLENTEKDPPAAPDGHSPDTDGDIQEKPDEDNTPQTGDGMQPAGILVIGGLALSGCMVLFILKKKYM